MEAEEIKCSGGKATTTNSTWYHSITKKELETEYNNFVNASEYTLETKKNLVAVSVNQMKKDLEEKCPGCPVLTLKVEKMEGWLRNC